MTGALPGLYFRIREGGAAVFRVTSGGREGRLELEPLASVSVKSGEIRTQGRREIGAEELAEIEGWVAARRAKLVADEAGAVDDLVERLNRVAHWAQSAAGPEDVARAGDALLLAMHDLRSVLVRKLAPEEE